MRIGWRKFFVASVLSVLGLLPACTVEVVEGPPAGAGGSGGSGGSGGKAGAPGDAAAPDGIATDAPATDGSSADGESIDATADTAPPDAGSDGRAADASTTPDVGSDAVDASTADTSVSDTVASDRGIGDVPGDAGAACFAEDPSDAGTANDCTALPYYGVRCGDAGSSVPSAGETLCTTLDTDLKATAFQELIGCLKALPGEDGGMDACSSAHEQGSDDCSRGTFNRSMCPVPESVVEGGLYGCAQIAASCGPDSGDGGIPVALCQAWLGPFHAAARQGMIDCYLGPDPGATSCRDKFENYCVFR